MMAYRFIVLEIRTTDNRSLTIGRHSTNKERHVTFPIQVGISKLYRLIL